MGTPEGSLWHQSETKRTRGADISDRQQLQDRIIELLPARYRRVRRMQKRRKEDHVSIGPGATSAHNLSPHAQRAHCFTVRCNCSEALRRGAIQSRNFHDAAPSRCRIRTPIRAEGSKFTAFTAIVVLRRFFR